MTQLLAYAFICSLVLTLAACTTSDRRTVGGLTPVVGVSTEETQQRLIASLSPETVEQNGDRCADEILKVSVNSGASWSEDAKAGVDSAFLLCLSQYVQIPTVNPPGHEELATRFLKRIFDRLGIESRLIDANGRSGLVAFVRPNAVSVTTRTASVLLYHHIDVVPVFQDQWLRPDLPFSGVIEPHPDQPNGPRFLWGRGSLDMKSVGIMQLFSMVFANQHRSSLNKTIAFIASPDEEVGASGAKGIVREIRIGSQLEELASAEVLLNEGGYGVSRNDRLVFLIGTEEKGGAWLSLSHENSKSLLVHLDQLMNLFEEGESRGRLNASCELISLSTPGQQVNVVPARTLLTVTCPESKGKVTRQSLEAAFREPFASHAGLEVQAIAVERDRFDVTISLASTGHGSLGALSSLQVAAKGLRNAGFLPGRPRGVRAPEFYRYHRTPATEGFISGLKTVYPITSRTGFLLRSVDMFSWFDGINQFFLKSTGEQAYSERLFRTSCTWTGFEATSAGASALVDCRLIHPGFVASPPSLHGPYFANELSTRARDPKLTIDVTNGWNYTSSSIESETFRKIERSIQSEFPEAVIAPWLTPTSSDNTWFRAPQTAQATGRAIPSYGFFPVSAGDLIETIHGSNERFPVDQAFKATRTYTKTVMSLAQ